MVGTQDNGTVPQVIAYMHFLSCFSLPYFTTFLVILGFAERSLSEEALDPIDLLDKLPPPVKQVSHWPFLTSRKYIIRKKKRKNKEVCGKYNPSQKVVNSGTPVENSTAIFHDGVTRNQKGW